MRCRSFVALFFISGTVIQPALAQLTPSTLGLQISATPAQSSTTDLGGQDANKEGSQRDREEQTRNERQRDEQSDARQRAEVPQSASQWLAELQNIITNANFQVSFVQTVAGKETIPYLWRHGIMDDGSELEQLNLQNGPGRELIRVNDVVSVFEPDVQPYSLRSKHINGPIPSALLYHPEQLIEGYEFVAVGRARVAGRSAQQIRIVSRDNTRFGYQLWLDESSGMLLKLNMLDLQGGLLEQIQVTAFAISQSPAEYFSRINSASLPPPMALSNAPARAHNWDVTYLPTGMREIKQDTRRLALTGQVVEYKLFSDGLVDVSVYVQPADDALGETLALRNEVSTFLTLTDGSAQVTVVGEIPLQTANAIANSLRPVNN
ncbi:sigma-E factor regulatory protein RseB [Alteromonas sp. KUL156]|uniref:MucB/RseB C-terminal domain-containing protein n=1 Tax=Alteromonas sp. KUL106 TaxID=2480799 RepID=UPI0012E5CAD4|nr:MucB/RseB C-terminal domain-containing protein [Alteromonas sp. KUL106]GFD70203.1 sigma-E factor regulatory protein RseB [Alteromonas sp. KUL106]GFD96732.1 sigma-E factor regulatory protein RseB [Alteromonas sp. KUL154]GFD99474.1 sigma-E factor regulatory protein RseB [Alteromonas sp. KUL156]